MKSIKETDNGKSIQVISRAADILRTLKSDNSGLSLGDIAKQVSLPRSTVQRIVNALVEERFIIPSSSLKGYVLGPEIQSMALSGKIDIVKLIHPILSLTSGKIRETIDLAVYKDFKMMFIDQVVSVQRLRTVSGVGEIFPMCKTANGKAVLAQLDDESVSHIVDNEIGREKDKTIIKKKLYEELAKIERSNIAYDLNQHTDGISAIGTAFQEPSGSLYAISIPVPSHRFEDKADLLLRELTLAHHQIVELLKTNN